jgi:hypothetical protein
VQQQQQFSIHAHTSTHGHSHGHHHHHHLPPPLVNAGANLLLGNGGALVPSSAAAAGLDPAALAASHARIAESASFKGDLEKIDLGLNSDDADVQLEAAKKLRVLLSSERDLLIRQVKRNHALVFRLPHCINARALRLVPIAKYNCKTN